MRCWWIHCVVYLLLYWVLRGGFVAFNLVIKAAINFIVMFVFGLGCDFA